MIMMTVTFQKQSPRGVCKKGILKSFAKFSTPVPDPVTGIFL